MKPIDKELRNNIIDILLMVGMAILIVFTLSSCTVFEWAYKTANDKIEISWKDEIGTVPIDSTIIHSKPTYYTILLDSTQYEMDFEKNGYSWWILKQNGILRIEVQRNDSLIYIYKK